MTAASNDEVDAPAGRPLVLVLEMVWDVLPLLLAAAELEACVLEPNPDPDPACGEIVSVVLLKADKPEWTNAWLKLP